MTPMGYDWGRRGPRRPKVVVVSRPPWLPDDDDMRDLRDLRVAGILAVIACGMAVATAVLGLAYVVSRVVG